MSWKTAYRGILPEPYLHGPVVAEREAFWEARFSSPGEDRRHVVLAEEDGATIGFVCVLLDDDPKWGGLIDNLHVLPLYKRRGIGRLLMSAAAEWAISREPEWPIHLWVIEANRSARSFYEAMGGDFIERALKPMPGGVDVPSLRVIWRDPRMLFQAR